MLSFARCSGAFVTSQRGCVSSDTALFSQIRASSCKAIHMPLHTADGCCGGFMNSILMFLLSSLLRQSKPLSEEHRDTEKVMKGYWSRSGRVSWDPTGLWAKQDCNVPERFLQLVSISVFCFQNCAGKDYSAMSCAGTNDFQESALHCNWNYVRVSTLVSSCPVWSQGSHSLLDHQHRFAELLLARAALWTLSRCTWPASLWTPSGPKGACYGQPHDVQSFFSFRISHKIRLVKLRFLNPKLKKEGDMHLNLSL